MKKSSTLNIVVAMVVIALVAGAGYMVVNKVKATQYDSKSQDENTKQSAEKEECKKRLVKFKDAYYAFLKDHGGNPPPKIDSLIPKYIASADELICPTAARWGKLGKPLSQGALTLDKTNYPVTYGFKFATQAYDRLTKKLQGKTPLISCTSHFEASYKAAYGKTPPDDANDEPTKSTLVDSVKSAPSYVIHQDGTISEDGK